jgi:hypothetical protein
MNVTLAETIVNQLSLAQNSSFEDCIWSCQFSRRIGVHVFVPAARH